MNPSTLPRISVITPSFNQGHFLEETIESVLVQKYSNLEYIVVDGGSTDGSVETIKRYETQLAFWVSEPDKGQTEAINKGLRRATGEIVTWLNSDDLHFPDTLATIASAFAQFNDDVIYGDYVLITRSGRIFLKRHEIPFHRDIMLYGVNFIGQPSAFFRRSLLERFGYLDESYRYAMDHEFWVRVATGGASFRHIKHFLSKYRYHSDSKTVETREGFLGEMELTRMKYGENESSATRRLRGYWARLKRQSIKIAYRGRLDFLGGGLNRLWYRFVDAREQARARSSSK